MAQNTIEVESKGEDSSIPNIKRIRKRVIEDLLSRVSFIIFQLYYFKFIF